MIVLQVPQFY
uniref:Uncharacterized protein n=1 Tax=Arundo donax TaxID=35708 RepID=A0A0A9GKJ1_ARUDO